MKKQIKIISGFTYAKVIPLNEFTYKKHEWLTVKRGKRFKCYHRLTGAQVLDVVGDTPEEAEKLSRKAIRTNQRVILLLKAVEEQSAKIGGA